MSLIGLIIVLLFLAAVLWFVNVKGAALNPTIKHIINIVVIAIAILIVLKAFGIWGEVRDIQVPKL